MSLPRSGQCLQLLGASFPRSTTNQKHYSLCSKGFCLRSLRKLGQEQKYRKDGTGRGEKEMLARKPHDFENLRSWANAGFDWWGAGSVD